MHKSYNHDEVLGFIETQLEEWPLTKKNYDALGLVDRRSVGVDGYDFLVQYNPTRIVSTGASIDKKSIEARKCFLCKDNRPAEQIVFPILDGWEMLVNPYPILPVHLTIVSNVHKPQKRVPKDIVEIAMSLPGMAVFFNGAKAGASAPDHLHLQAVMKDELPLIRLVEKVHPISAKLVLPSDALLPNFPFFFFTGIVAPEESGAKTLLAGLSIGGSESGDRLDDPELVNTFFWVGDNGLLRFIAIPRKAHRPSCHFDNEPDRLLVSPGCIDMAGMLITPRRNDYDSLNADKIRAIYKEVGF